MLATLASPEEWQEQDVYVDLCKSGGVQALTNLIYMVRMGMLLLLLRASMTKPNCQGPSC